MTIRYIAVQIPGKGWTVAKVEGSKRTGRKITTLKEYPETYTMQQAQMAAEAAQRDNRQSNPRPRLSAKKPTRVSSATGKKPSKRLIARRKANTRKGYFPNPTARQRLKQTLADQKKAYPYEVWMHSGAKWLYVARYPTEQQAKDAATKLANITYKQTSVRI